MLALLKQANADDSVASVDADEIGNAQESDVEDEVNVSADDSVDNKIDANGAKESETIVALKLKLQLHREKAEGEMRVMKETARLAEKLAEVEWLRENERIAVLGANGATAHDDADVGSGAAARSIGVNSRTWQMTRYSFHLCNRKVFQAEFDSKGILE